MEKAFLLIIGIIGFLSWGVISYIKTRNFIRKAVYAKGKIINVELRKVRYKLGFVDRYFPIITFQDSKGNKITFSPKYGTRSANKYNTGEELMVLYDSDDPNNARINSFMQLWGNTVSALIASALLIIGVIAIVFLKNNRGG